MLMNQHLFNRALKKRKNEQKKRGLNSLTAQTSLDGLSINLQSELLNETKSHDFKKVTIKEKKIKKKSNETEEKDLKEEKSDDKDNKREDNNTEDYLSDLEIDEDFEIINDPIKEENELFEEADKELKNKSGGGDNKNIKNVVVSFF